MGDGKDDKDDNNRNRITKEYWHMSKNDDQWMRWRMMTEVKIDAERLWDWLSMIENMPINLRLDDE